MLDTLFSSMRVLPIGKTVILFSRDFANQPPLLGQFALPLSCNRLAFTIVVPLGITEVLLVIKLGLS